MDISSYPRYCRTVSGRAGLRAGRREAIVGQWFSGGKAQVRRVADGFPCHCPARVEPAYRELYCGQYTVTAATTWALAAGPGMRGLDS
jgi:hypothetical protein